MLPSVSSKVSSQPEIPHQETLAFLQDKSYLLVRRIENRGNKKKENRGNSTRICEGFPYAHLETMMCDSPLPTIVACILPPSSHYFQIPM